MIPNGWDESTFGRIIETFTDYVANGSFASLKENVTYTDAESYAILLRLQDHSKKYSKDFVYIDRHSYDYLNKSKVYPKDIIISNVGARCGFTFRAPTLPKPMTLGPNSVLLRTKQNDDYIYQWLVSDIGQSKIDEIKSTNAQPKFNKTDFRKIRILLPPLPEQKKIAEILSSVDDAIQATRKVIDQTEKVKAGLLQELMTRGIGHTKFKMTEIGEIPEEWTTPHISEVLYQVSRPMIMDDEIDYQLLTVKRRQEGIVSRGQSKGKDIKVKSQFFVKGGDFLISKRQIVHGACEVVPESFSNAIVSNEYAIFRTNETLDMDYFRWFSRSAMAMNYFLISSIGVHIEKMLFKVDQWLRLPMPLPPIKEQQQIASLLSSLEAKSKIEESSLNKLFCLKQGLMQDLLTGKVRVKVS